MPLGQQLTFLRACALLALIEVGLRSLSLPVLARMLGVRLERGPERAGRDRVRLPPEVRPILRVVDAMLRDFASEGLCLKRSLLAGGLLRKYRPTLRIGVASREGKIGAHAWLELDGTALPEMPGSSRRGFKVLT
jgi:hypothetical protein